MTLGNEWPDIEGDLDLDRETVRVDLTVATVGDLDRRPHLTMTGLGDLDLPRELDDMRFGEEFAVRGAQIMDVGAPPTEEGRFARKGDCWRDSLFRRTIVGAIEGDLRVREHIGLTIIGSGVLERGRPRCSSTGDLERDRREGVGWITTKREDLGRRTTVGDLERERDLDRGTLSRMSIGGLDLSLRDSDMGWTIIGLGDRLGDDLDQDRRSDGNTTVGCRSDINCGSQGITSGCPLKATA